MNVENGELNHRSFLVGFHLECTYIKKRTIQEWEEVGGHKYVCSRLNTSDAGVSRRSDGFGHDTEAF